MVNDDVDADGLVVGGVMVDVYAVDDVGVKVEGDVEGAEVDICVVLCVVDSGVVCVVDDAIVVSVVDSSERR